MPQGVAEFTVGPLDLERGVTLVGRVVGPDGRPESGAEVSGSSISPTQRGRPVEAMTDRAGAFRIEGVEPRNEVRLSARRGGAVTAANPEFRANSVA